MKAKELEAIQGLINQVVEAHKEKSPFFMERCPACDRQTLHISGFVADAGYFSLKYGQEYAPSYFAWGSSAEEVKSYHEQVAKYLESQPIHPARYCTLCGKVFKKFTNEGWSAC